MRYAVVALALLAGLPGVAKADPVVVDTYVFEGCIQNRSCHTATVRIYDFGGPTLRAIQTEFVSVFMESGSFRSYVMTPGLHDLDDRGAFCTRTGTVTETHANAIPAGTVPTAMTIFVGYGPPTATDCMGSGDIQPLVMTLQTTTAPEPGTIALLLPGLAGVGALRRRRMRRDGSV